MLRSTMISSSSLLCFVLLLARCAEATIAVGDLEFESMTAVFGLPWNNGVEYKAHLQYLDAHQFLCGDDEGILSLPNVNRQLNSHHNKTTTMHSVSDDLKGSFEITNDSSICICISMSHNNFFEFILVALLVSRGACSFEEKARSAMLMENVAFIIIYDDRSRAHLVPMSATDPAGIDVRLIFVSHATGIRKFTRARLIFL